MLGWIRRAINRRLKSYLSPRHVVIEHEHNCFSCRWQKPSITKRLVRMAVKKFGELVSDTVTVPNLKELMDTTFTIVGLETVEAGDYERLLLTVEINGKREVYGTFSDSIKQKVKRFVEPAILAGDGVSVKLIEVETKKGRKAMTFTDGD